MESIAIYFLADVVIAGYSLSGGMDEIVRILEAADRVLAADGGRNCLRPLTDDELKLLGYCR